MLLAPPPPQDESLPDPSTSGRETQAATPVATLADVTVVIPNYNGMAVLPQALESLRPFARELGGVLLVDDGSTDGSPSLAEALLPQVRVLSMGRNTRHVGAVRNAGIRAATTRYVFLMDNDIGITREGLLELLAVLEARPGTAVVTPRLVWADRPDRIYFDGDGMHFLAISTQTCRGRPVSDHPPAPPRPSWGGGIMLLDREAVLAVGGYDEEYRFGWGEDGELHLRLWLAGRPCLHVSSVTGLHFARSHGTARAGAQLYNRYRVLATMYKARTLVVLLPLLLLFELALFAVFAASGMGGVALGAARDAWRDRRRFLDRRRAIQATRRISDRQWLTGAPLTIPVPALRSPVLMAGAAIAGKITLVYWNLFALLVA